MEARTESFHQQYNQEETWYATRSAGNSTTIRMRKTLFGLITANPLKPHPIRTRRGNSSPLFFIEYNTLTHRYFRDILSSGVGCTSPYYSWFFYGRHCHVDSSCFTSGPSVMQVLNTQSQRLARRASLGTAPKHRKRLLQRMSERGHDDGTRSRERSSVLR